MNVPSNIPFAYPFIKKEEEDAALRVLRSGWLTTGKEALAFEKEFAAFLDPTGKLGIKALAVNSATSGLHLAVEACGIQPGDVVITSPYTFTATAEVVRYLGADVAFVDVVPGGYLIDPEAVRRCAARLARGLCAYPDRGGESKDFGPQGGFGPRGRPALIMPIHVAGLPCDMAALKDVAAEFGMKIIEDAAHSFPSKMEDGSYAGDQGDLGVFSFYATKTISTGEGGMVVTRDAKLAERVSIMRSHGMRSLCLEPLYRHQGQLALPGGGSGL
ncbi:hypothetical protein MASR2M78_31670 [Treponema sp.]